MERKPEVKELYLRNESSWSECSHVEIGGSIEMLGAMQKCRLDRLLPPMEFIATTHLRICCFLCPPGLHGCIMELENVLDEKCKQQLGNLWSRLHNTELFYR